MREIKKTKTIFKNFIYLIFFFSKNTKWHSLDEKDNSRSYRIVNLIIVEGLPFNSFLLASFDNIFIYIFVSRDIKLFKKLIILYSKLLFYTIYIINFFG